MAALVAAEAREKLKLYKELGFLGSGTFAEVSRYVRVTGVGRVVLCRAALPGPPCDREGHRPAPQTALLQHDMLHDRIVAIKRVRKVSFKDGINLGAVKELQALKELDHPNVLKVCGRPRARAALSGRGASLTPRQHDRHRHRALTRHHPNSRSSTTRSCTATVSTSCSSTAQRTCLR